jgi:NAD(P)H-flavin reductase
LSIKDLLQHVKDNGEIDNYTASRQKKDLLAKKRIKKYEADIKRLD